MGIEFSIHGATPRSGKPLCITCKHAAVLTGQNCEEWIRCTAEMFPLSKGIVTIKVASCGSYHPSNVPWLHEMKEIAWNIEARKRGPVGFSDNTQMEIVITRPSENKNADAPAMPTTRGGAALPAKEE